MAVTQHTLNRSGKRMGVNETAGALPDIHPLVQQWQRNVISQGVVPSTKTIAALNRFVYALAFYNLLSKMAIVNCFVPDGLAAALTPLITGGGISPWTNQGFVSGDLTVNGLAGNASNKVLTTGIIPSSSFSNSNFGGSVYVTTPFAATQGWEYGTFSTSQTTYWVGFTAKYNSGGTSLNIYDDTGVNVGTSPGSGFYSSNRVSLNDARVYWGHSSSSLAQIGSTSTTTAQQIPVGNTIVVFATKSQGGSVFQYTDHRISFIGFHDGLNQPQAQDLLKCVQQLRVDLGGGFI